MPITVERIDRAPVNSRRVVPLFADTRICNSYLNDSGKYMFKNYKIRPLTQFTLDALDRLSPMLKSHQRIGKFVLQSCEKLIKLSEKVL